MRHQRSVAFRRSSPVPGPAHDRGRPPSRGRHQATDQSSRAPPCLEGQDCAARERVDLRSGNAAGTRLGQRCREFRCCGPQRGAGAERRRGVHLRFDHHPREQSLVFASGEMKVGLCRRLTGDRAGFDRESATLHDMHAARDRGHRIVARCRNRRTHAFLVNSPIEPEMIKILDLSRHWHGHCSRYDRKHRATRSPALPSAAG